MHNGTILHLTGMESTKYGGLEHYLLELIQLCNQKGYHTILQYESLPHSSAYLQDLQDLGAKVMPTSTNLRPLQSAHRIAALIRSIRPEIIQTHFGEPVRFGAPIARMLRVQKITTMVHCVPGLKKTSLRRFAYNCYDCILCVSNFIARDLTDAGVNRRIVSTHYLGLFGDRTKSAEFGLQLRNEFDIPQQSVVIACIAFDAPEKGLDILLQALKRIVHNHPQIYLIVVGVDPQCSTLPEQAARLGISNCIRWTGIRDEGWQILSAADIYVQPSRSEGLPFAILEAMQLGLPIIATRVGGVPEAVADGETGYLVSPVDAESLATAIERMLAEPSKMTTMGEAGHHRYQCFFRGEDSIKVLAEKHFALNGVDEVNCSEEKATTL